MAEVIRALFETDGCLPTERTMILDDQWFAIFTGYVNANRASNVNPPSVARELAEWRRMTNAGRRTNPMQRGTADAIRQFRHEAKRQFAKYLGDQSRQESANRELLGEAAVGDVVYWWWYGDDTYGSLLFLADGADLSNLDEPLAIYLHSRPAAMDQGTITMIRKGRGTDPGEIRVTGAQDREGFKRLARRVLTKKTITFDTAEADRQADRHVTWLDQQQEAAGDNTETGESYRDSNSGSSQEWLAYLLELEVGPGFSLPDQNDAEFFFVKQAFAAYLGVPATQIQFPRDEVVYRQFQAECDAVLAAFERQAFQTVNRDQLMQSWETTKMYWWKFGEIFCIASDFDLSYPPHFYLSRRERAYGQIYLKDVPNVRAKFVCVSGINDPREHGLDGFVSELVPSAWRVLPVGQDVTQDPAGEIASTPSRWLSTGDEGSESSWHQDASGADDSLSEGLFDDLLAAHQTTRAEDDSVIDRHDDDGELGSGERRGMSPSSPLTFIDCLADQSSLAQFTSWLQQFQPSLMAHLNCAWALWDGWADPQRALEVVSKDHVGEGAPQPITFHDQNILLDYAMYLIDPSSAQTLMEEIFRDVTWDLEAAYGSFVLQE